MVRSRWARDAEIDAAVQRTDPLVGSRLNDDALASSLEEAGLLILQHAGPARPLRRRRALPTPRRLVVIAVMVLSVSGVAAAATGVFVNAHTHTFNHGRQILEGGPGENLNVAGTNFDQVVLHESAGISFPADYAAWRSFAVKHAAPPPICPADDHRPSCTILMSTGMINAGIAQSAFCAWVLDWRHAELAGNTDAVRQAAAVIAKAPRWKATTDLGSAYDAEYFGWMKSFVGPVKASDVSAVDRLIASNSGGYFWFDDPTFVTWLRRPWYRQHSHINVGRVYLRYLETGRL
jgi:hypothetical protein